ncbi:cell division protein SepF, partial [Corynebacterium pyruviciproducens]
QIVDFAAGLVFGARGTMEKVARKTFAIIPEGADITLAELERAARR